MCRALTFLVIIGALIPGCKDTNNTRIVVAVWSDLEVPSEIDRIRIEATGTTRTVEQIILLKTNGESGQTTLPVTLDLVPLGAKDATFTMKVTGLHDNTEVVAQNSRLAFVPGQRLMLKLFLARDCYQMLSCPANFTCAAGACKQSIDISTLLPYNPSLLLSPPDAGTMPSKDSGGDLDGLGGGNGGTSGSSNSDGARGTGDVGGIYSSVDGTGTGDAGTVGAETRGGTDMGERVDGVKGNGADGADGTTGEPIDGSSDPAEGGSGDTPSDGQGNSNICSEANLWIDLDMNGITDCAENMLKNGQFTSGIEGWLAGNDYTVAFNSADSGGAMRSGSLQVTNTAVGDPPDGVLRGPSQCVQVEETRDYLFAAQVFIPSGQGVIGLEADTHWRYFGDDACANWLLFGTYVEGTVHTDAWQLLTSKFTVPAGVRSVKFGVGVLKMVGANKPGHAYFDNVLVHQLP